MKMPFEKSAQVGWMGRMTRSTADKWFSLYIRMRDIKHGEYCQCITCNKLMHWKYESDCGHYATRNKPMTRFHEQNCHAQCKACNDFKKGEQAKHGFAIDRKYGPGTAEGLIGLSEIRGQKTHTGLSLKEIAKKYRIKAKILSKKIGVEL